MLTFFTPDPGARREKSEHFRPDPGKRERSDMGRGLFGDGRERLRPQLHVLPAARILL